MLEASLGDATLIGIPNIWGGSFSNGGFDLFDVEGGSILLKIFPKCKCICQL